MSRVELNELERMLTNNTVLSELIKPLSNILSSTRYTKNYPILTMPLFFMFGFLRHLKGTKTSNEYLQELQHITEHKNYPLARSTWSDALHSSDRFEVLQDILPALVESAKLNLPDRLSGVPGLASRSVYAFDGTYQIESCHFKKKTKKDGGSHSPKGHCLLPCFDVRLGIPINAYIEISSKHEISILKSQVLDRRGIFYDTGALVIADRGLVDCPFWDSVKSSREIEVITRYKINMVIEESEKNKIRPLLQNEGIIADETVKLKASNKVWRLVTYRTPEGQEYRYLTNNFDLEPGVVAFLYLRRWDEEKCFDTWKNDFAQLKAWGNSKTALRNQTFLAVITSILVAIFVNKHMFDWGIFDEKSLKKQENRFNDKLLNSRQPGSDRTTVPWHFLFYKNTSKISKQVLRFLKSCFMKKPSEQLYESQLKPKLLKYF